MKNLVLIESPGKIRTLEGILGRDYVVMASTGHIRLLSRTGKYNLGINIDGDFEPTYENDPSKKDIISNLRSAIKSAEHVYIASDDDREGESIAASLVDIFKIPREKYDRITFSEITKSAVENGLRHPRDIDRKMVESQETRRLLDRIIGFRLSHLMLSNMAATSAGRVQSAALKILADREREIKAFIPEDYYELYLPFSKGGKDYQAKYIGTGGVRKSRISLESEANLIASECDGCGKYEVASIESSDRVVQPRLPYTTSTFQQDVSAKLGYGSKRSMEIAQHLYEGVEIGGEHIGLITYMRTDSTRLSDEFVAAAKDLISSKYGKQYYFGVRANTSKEKIQDAHEGIRPSHLEWDPERIRPYIENDEYRVYSLVYQRALASLMEAATITDTEIVINCKKKYNFSIIGHQTKFDGYRKIYMDYTEDADKAAELPEMKVGEDVKAGKIIIAKKATTPPARYTEASLVKKMEACGIGRPSTYAATVETLKKREYVELSNKSIVVTDKGLCVSEALDRYFPTIINVEYTASMETMLDQVASGEKDEVAELKGFYKDFAPLVSSAEKSMKDEKKAKGPLEQVGRKCPNCGGELVYRVSHKGVRFICCSKYPKCHYTESIDKDGNPVPHKAPAVSTGIKCPHCHKGTLVQRRNSKTGEIFYGCSNYFHGCKYTIKGPEFELKYGKKEGKK
jgi:DNA topoisomerase-1